MEEKLIYLESELPQKSDSWLEFRNSGIGASEISIIRGTFPTFWCTSHELFLKKMGNPYEFSNEYIENGNKYEEKARKYVENYLKNCSDLDKSRVFCKNIYDRTSGFDVKEPNFEQFTAKCKGFPQIFASFDGIDIKNQLVLEIKCPSQQVFTKFLRNRIPTVPKMYFDQIQAQLLIAKSHWDVERGLFALFFNDGVYFEDKKTKITNLIRLILIETELDLEYCKEMLVDCKKFLDMINNKKWTRDWKDK